MTQFFLNILFISKLSFWMIFPEIRTFMPENSKSGEWMTFPEISHNGKIEISKKMDDFTRKFLGQNHHWEN